MLIKNAEALEQLARVDVIVVDKTGTLTEGKPRVMAVEAAPGFTEADVLRLAAGVERGSEHPLASAVVAAAESRGLAIPAVSRFISAAGKGVSGVVDGRAVDVGTPDHLVGVGVDVTPIGATIDSHRRAGQTSLVVGVDGRAAGVVAVADAIRATTPEAIAMLQSRRAECRDAHR